MTDDIVTRLYDLCLCCRCGCEQQCSDCEAADEIERLRADRDSDSGAGATVLTIEETQQLIAALSEALVRIGRMKKVRNG